jgi:BirA family biotin operon repressor/biotin-[acetyl-CoA-carboxylase] ligase
MRLPFVRTIVDREVVGSTSDVARDVIGAGCDLPLLVRARRQTKGRGRGSNGWWSDEGSLTVTFGLDPAAHGLRPEHEPRIALAAAVAVVEAVTAVVSLTTPLGIRWPNDIEAAGRKLGGVLPERVETVFGPRALVGIGLNLKSRLDQAPPKIRSMAVSASEIAVLGGNAIDTDQVLCVFAGRFEACLHRLARDEPGLAERWAELDTLLGEMVAVDIGARVATGMAAGIDAEGSLILQSEDRHERLFGGRVLRAALRS